MKKLFVGLTSLVWAASLLSLVPVASQAANTITSNDLWGYNTVGAYQNEGFSTTDPRQTVARIIKVALGFLGSIAVILIILAGFKWMTAAGNEDKVAESKKLMSAAFVGLVIILTAFALTNFVINSVITSIGH
jgi:type IV secretory pathway VirB2 component (pilin)